jgi:pyruvate dehydrogenase E1 component
MPEGVRDGILRGLYLYRASADGKPLHVELFGSGPILNHALRAQEILASEYGVSADVWSATSYTELRRDCLACERQARLHPGEPAPQPWLVKVLGGRKGPFIAASDFVKSIPDQIARWMPGRFVPLGTDGFGMSDTREMLRRHFEIDAECITYAALEALHREGRLDVATLKKALEKLGINPDKRDPMAT